MINEGLLEEALANIDQDVDAIYDRFFRKNVELIRSDQYNLADLREKTIPAKTFEFMRLFKSQRLLDAWDNNKCNVIINSKEGNYYSPTRQTLAFGMNPEAMKMLERPFNMDGSLMQVAKLLDDTALRRWFNDISEAKIKGSINHELAHYIDDSLNNRHILKKITRLEARGGQYNASALKQFRQGHTDVYQTDMEIEAQIHNVYQLKRAYAAKWNSLTFLEMAFLDPSLYATYNNLRHDKNELRIWTDKMRKRMARENLLGDWMRYN